MEKTINNQKLLRSRYSSEGLTGSSKLESQPISDSKGYTLVEVLVVIGLISILMGIAVPQMSTLTNTFRLKGATRLVWGDLQNAKMTAIKTNGSTTVTFNSTTNYSYPQGGGTTFTRDLSNEYPNITVSKTGGGTITIGSTGTTSNATLTIQGSSGTKTISVLGTGRIIIN
jgi:prepilin-type N-terminal cleavage/methylation domain-containing protein